MVHCVAFGCNNKSDGGTKGFFLFPKDETLRRKWTDAIYSLRCVDGKLVPFVPSKTSRVCSRHFTDESFVHSPSVMNSVGVSLKLQLVKGAVPTVFPETVSYKENLKPQSNRLGPAKRKRTTYGAFEKRNRKACVDEIIASHQLLEKDEENARLEQQLLLEEVELGSLQTISSVEVHGKTISRACQTTELIASRPTEHKSFQVKVQVRECGTLAAVDSTDTMCGPDIAEQPVEKSFQFPENEEGVEVQSDESDDEYPDNVDDDPDWEPSADDMADLVDSEDDDEDSTVWHDCVGDIDQVKEHKYIVFESCLLQLLQWCCVCSAVCRNIKKKVVGCMLVVETVCESGHSRIWRSQSIVSGAPVGNVLSAGAIVFSGVSPSKVMKFFKFSNITMISERTFTRYQRSFVIPAISNVWGKTQSDNLVACRGRDIRVGGDARCCSPGHTAKYGSYTLMDLETGKVLATELVQSNEVKNSNAMELEGLKRAITVIEDMGVTLTDITTDRHVQVRKYLREAKGQINHWFDSWHVAKSIKSKLSALAKKRGCEMVAKWTQSISNHLYFCAATSEGDGELVKQKWLSVLNHITNKHEGHGDKFPSCTHGPIDRDWIKSGSKAHKEMQLVLGSTRLVSDIKKLSPVDQTSGLEAHHKVVCQFAPKFVSFSYAVMKQRINLAALHTCSNAGRAQAKTREGLLRYNVSYPKYKGGKHIVKPVMEDCSYDYIESLNDELLRLRNKYKSHKKAQDAAQELYIAPPPLCYSAKHVSKSEAVSAHKSRFVGQ